MILMDFNKKKIYEKDIQYYAHSLKDFVKVYRDHIYIDNDKDFHYLEILDNFADLLLQKRYSELFDDDVEIIYEDAEIIDYSKYEAPF